MENTKATLKRTELLLVSFYTSWHAPRWLIHTDVSNVFISNVRTSPWRRVFPTNRSSVFSVRLKPGFLPVSTPFPTLPFTPDARSMAVRKCQRLNAWSRLRKRTPDSGACQSNAWIDKEALQVALGRKYWRQTTSGKPLSLCVMRPDCSNVVPAGSQVCLCRPAATRPSVRRHPTWLG